MNLLESPWIPIQQAGDFRHITLEELLTTEADLALALPRDDMEAAALQLLIALTQTVFTPQDRDEYRQRVREPLTPEAYRPSIEPYRDWFDLAHPKTPFMQTRGVSAQEPTPIQKLFIGLPEGNNHAFFNDAGEIGGVCPSCAAIALFNQAVACPSFGGGFKGALRGAAPVTTLIAGQGLRETLWLNVLTDATIATHYPNAAAQNRPTWIDPLAARTKYHVHEIGLLRGLFWQPARLELAPGGANGRCDACHAEAPSLIRSFNKEKFVYDLDGLWLHPHSPRQWELKKGNQEKLRYLSFTTSAPAWTQLNQYLIDRDTTAKALVVEQCRQLLPMQPVKLIVAGYRNKQASVTLRRHELFSIPLQWQDNAGIDQLEKGLDFALAVRKLLRNKLYGFGKQAGAVTQDASEQQFDKRSEPLVHALFTDMARRERKAALDGFRDQIKRLARNLFEQSTQPYTHSPKGLETYAHFRNGFEAGLAAL